MDANLKSAGTLDESVNVQNFKRKTAELFKPIDEWTAEDIEDYVYQAVGLLFEVNDVDARAVDLAIVGSRSRGLEKAYSDLDIAVEIESGLKEDALFNILHEKPIIIGGVTVDINPIRAEQTGTLGEYLSTAEKTIYENRNSCAFVEDGGYDDWDIVR